MAQDVELVEQNGGLRRMRLRRILEWLPHIHDGEPDFLLVFRADEGIELIHVGFGAAFAAKPDRSPLFEIAHHDAVGVTLPDRDLVDPDHAGARRSGARQLFAHVLLFEFLHRMPIQVHPLGHVLDRHRSAQGADRQRQALGELRVRRQ